MPTDEQLREQFEDWGRTYYLNLIRTRGGQYQDVLTEAAYAAWRARDAEVQALREQVDHAKRIFQYAEVRSGYCVCGETLARHSHLADCSYTDRGQWESELWLKSVAALRGEEGTNDE